LGFLKRGFYFELLLSCVPFSYARVKSRAADPSFDQEDEEDPEYTAPGNEGVVSLPTM
jgi:hypothetical protein